MLSFINIILDNSVSMSRYMDSINRMLSASNFISDFNCDPYLLENNIQEYGMKCRLCTFSDTAEIREFELGKDNIKFEVSDSTKTNLGYALQKLNHINAFSHSDLNFIIYDGLITDIHLFNNQASNTYRFVKEDYRLPAFFSLAIGPIADVNECKPLKGYGYSIKDFSSRESFDALESFIPSLLSQYKAYYPSLTLDPLVNQWRPKVHKGTLQVYEIEYK